MPIRYDLMQRFSFIMAVINLAAVLFFAVLLFVIPIFTNLAAYSRFADLDKAGVINSQQVNNIPEGSGLTITSDPNSYMSAIPDYIVASTRSAQRFASISGLVICLANTVIWFSLWYIQKGASVVIQKIPKHQIHNTPHRPIDPDADTVDIAS